jgi:hypothetical protein
MLIYKFRITLEENENFVREIEIKPTQTFEDFHNALLDCTILEEDQMASFFVCDIQWRKHQEITLIETEEEKDNRFKRADKPAPKLMSETTLNDCIDNPNAQLIYLNDLKNIHTFYIELFKIYDNNEEATFPRCVKRVSELPKTLVKAHNPEVVTFEVEEPIAESEFEDEFDDTLIDDDSSLLMDDIFEETNPNENN